MSGKGVYFKDIAMWSHVLYVYDSSEVKHGGGDFESLKRFFNGLWRVFVFRSETHLRIWNSF